MPRPTYTEEFKVAFSLAGEQRSLIEPIALELEKLVGEGTVFYDEWFEAMLAGKEAELELYKIYAERTDLVVVCISQNYESKLWPKIEAEAIRAFHATLRATGGERDRLRLLPIRVGPGEVQGFFPTTICPDARERTPQKMAQLIADRLDAWRGHEVRDFTPVGAALLMPAVASLARAVEDIAVSLRDEKVAILRVNPRLEGQVRAEAIQQAVAQADVIVDWIQDSKDPLDQEFITLAEEIRQVAANPASPKQTLRWMPMDMVASDAESRDPVTQRFHLESFKKEVLKRVRTPANPFAARGTRVVIAASGADAALVDEIIQALPEGRPIDARLDDLHAPPDFGATQGWDEEIKDALRRHGVTSVLFIDGGCRREWIDRRLRAYDVYREEIAENLVLVVWDRPQTPQKQTRLFRPEYLRKIPSPNATGIVPHLPP